MNLSADFTLAELTKTTTGLVNVPSDAEAEKLLYLCQYILQPIRDHWGILAVTSGFRSAAVNAKVGSSPTSQHLSGEAVDFVCMSDLDSVFDWIVKQSGLKFGQAIHETRDLNRWIHISLPRLNQSNQQALIYNGKVYTPYG